MRVCIFRATGAPIGVTLVDFFGALLIAEVQCGGLLEEWNKRHPWEQVKPGCRISSVNGIRGDADRMYAELATGVGLMRLVIERQSMQGLVQTRPCVDAQTRARLSMQFRALTEEDYDALLELDETVPNRDVAGLDAVALLPLVLASDCCAGQCRICLEDLQGDMCVMRLPCNHVFHPACASRWLTQCKARCPICCHPLGDAKEDDSDAIVAAPPGDAKDFSDSDSEPGADPVVPLEDIDEHGGNLASIPLPGSLDDPLDAFLPQVTPVRASPAHVNAALDAQVASPARVGSVVAASASQMQPPS